MARYVTDTMLEATRDLDRILIADQNGNTRGKIVFKTVLFFEEGGTKAGQKRAIDALAYLARDMAEHLTHMQTADPSAAIASFDLEEFISRSHDAIETGFQSTEFDLDAGFFGQPFSSQTGGVSAFGGSVTAMAPLTPENGDLSMLEVSTSLMWDAVNDYRRHIQRTIDAARIVNARHGLAGFAVQFDRIYESSTAHGLSFPYLKRFPGLHCSRDASFIVSSTLRRSTTDRVFSTNWLTLLADDLVSELGGPDALANAIGANCDMHAYEGGVLLQAGPYPQSGDVNQGILLKNYRSVAAATAPVRFEDYPVGFMVVPPAHDSLAETLAWVRRFD